MGLRWQKLWHKEHWLTEAVESTRLMDACAEQGVNCALSPEVLDRTFLTRKMAWLKLGRQVCSHGVFFDAPFGTPCRCKNASSDDLEAWAKAKFMLAIEPILRCIVVVPFVAHRFQPLGKLEP